MQRPQSGNQPAGTVIEDLFVGVRIATDSYG